MAEQQYHWDLSHLAELKGHRVFLTGGTGFFGKWLLRFFIESFPELGVEVVVLSRQPEIFKNAYPQFGQATNVSFVQGDVRSFEFPGVHCDYIIHAATPVGSDSVPYDSPEMYSIIVEGTKRVLDFARYTGVRRLLYVSSGAVYGAQSADVELIDEGAPCYPSNAYGKGKFFSEGICLEQNVDVVVARCFAFVGEYLQLDDRFAIGNFILDCLHGRMIEISGDGTPLRSYLHGADLVEWLVAMLVRGNSGEIYNVGSDQAVSIADLARIVKRVLDAPSKIVVQVDSSPLHPRNRYVPSVRKATQELGLSIKVGLEDAIQSTSQDWKV